MQSSQAYRACKSSCSGIIGARIINSVIPDNEPQARRISYGVLKTDSTTPLDMFIHKYYLYIIRIEAITGRALNTVLFRIYAVMLTHCSLQWNEENATYDHQLIVFANECRRCRALSYV
jgi:hypothetical protein